MLSLMLTFFLLAGIIVVAGTYLSRFADEIAEATGFGRLLVGSVLLAGATSLPELSVDISAVRQGMPDLAIGDLMGSSLFNLLILAILDLSIQSKGRMLSRESAAHALSGCTSALLMAVAAINFLAKPILGSSQLLGISYGVWLIAITYAFGLRLIYFDQKAAREASIENAQEHPRNGKNWRLAALGFTSCALAIIFVGPHFAETAGKLAELSGLGKTFIGTTLVAFSTSLPELVSSIAALRMGAWDLAVGNIFGSNAFNMLLLLPLDIFQTGPILTVVSAGHALTCLAGICATLIVVLGQLYHVEKRRAFLEPDAILVIGIVFSALGIIWGMGE